MTVNHLRHPNPQGLFEHWCQVSTGAMGVFDKSLARLSAPALPPPENENFTRREFVPTESARVHSQVPPSSRSVATQAAVKPPQLVGDHNDELSWSRPAPHAVAARPTP
jgi:hypothetical protein